MEHEMSGTCKTIFDPIHGSIRTEGVFLDILDRHEMQRLRSVKQLDMGYLVFPGANHTRFEHSLGVYYLSGRMASSLGLSQEDSDAVRAAGLLHDVCHSPFSHTMEEITVDRTGMDHMDMAAKLINGEIPTHRERDEDLFGESGTIAEVLEAGGISSRKVCNLISKPVSGEDGIFTGGTSFFPSGDYVHQIIHGPVDADQMDYLMRDAHYTGVSWGAIDSERILNTISVHNDRIVVQRSGAVAAEGLMVSRALMYSSVYYHATVRIAKMMVTKAFEASSLDVTRLYAWDDADMTNALIGEGGTASNLMRSVLNRRLYKTALIKYSEDADDETVEALAQFSKYRKRKILEQEIADKAGVDVSQVIVDMPSESAMLSKIKIGKTDVPVMDSSGKVRPLTKFSPLAKSLQSRDPFGWKVMVAAPKEHAESVSKAARRILNL